jgi:D-inositol-3-phosphate glycosyltransferase
MSLSTSKSVVSSPKLMTYPGFSASSNRPKRQAIALISEHGDPAAEIGKEEAGGQNVYVRQVGEALAELGWHVDMFTRKTNANAPTIIQHSPHCRTIRLVAGPEAFVHRDELFQYMPQFVQAFHEFQSKNGVHYPLIHTNYWMSAWVGLQLRTCSNIQLVHTYHSLGAVKYQTVENSPRIAQTRLTVERDILEQADCVVATSPQEQNQLRSLVSHNGKIEIIPCGTDINNFRVLPKPAAREALGLHPNEQILLYVGRFDPRKGIETLVKACALLASGKNGFEPTPIRLVIVGGSDPKQADGRERQRIEHLVQELGLAEQTTFAGRVGHDQLPLYYTAADLCVIPSHYEPFGLVAIEAMACGTPVIASAVGGLKFSVVSEETGLLVPPQDVTAFAQAIYRVLSNEEWAHQLRQQAAHRVQTNFSWQGVAAQLSKLYRRLLAQPHHQKSFNQKVSSHQPQTMQEAIAPDESKQQGSAKHLTKVS